MRRRRRGSRQLGDEFVSAKTKLRELLDISSEDHKRRQRELVAAAQSFVNTTEARVAGISNHFAGMDKQINNLLDANYSMREIYAVLNDATKEAHTHNEARRESLQPTAGAEEGELEKMNRERSKRDLENYIASLNASSVDTTAVLAELTNSSHRIKSMKDGNEQQISKTRQLHSSGVAGVADQLSTVLQAVSAAALGESSEMARMSLDRMNTKTQDLSQKEVIRLALGTHETEHGAHEGSSGSRAVRRSHPDGDEHHTRGSQGNQGPAGQARGRGEERAARREGVDRRCGGRGCRPRRRHPKRRVTRPTRAAARGRPNPFNLGR